MLEQHLEQDLQLEQQNLDAVENENAEDERDLEQGILQMKNFQIGFTSKFSVKRKTIQIFVINLYFRFMSSFNRT